MVRALHFGAGNIGRGFIGKILCESGVDVVFADVVPDLIENLKQRKSFKVHVVGSNDRYDEVNITDAVYSNKPEVIDEMLKADIITTAVGPRILERIAGTFAKAIIARNEKDVKHPLNIIACENAIRASSTLKEHVVKQLEINCHSGGKDLTEILNWVKDNVGFVDSAVDRIVPPSKESDPLGVTVEEFCEWVVDQTQFVGANKLPKLEGLVYTDNLDAFVERKLLTVNTGHAVCAYVGKIFGHKEIRTAILDPNVRPIVEGAMKESGSVLLTQYGMNGEEHSKYINKIITRFENPYLVDEISRVGREPIRKLSAQDRLIKPLIGYLKYSNCSENPTNLYKGIAAALLYEELTDPQAVQLQEQILKNGWAKTIIDVGGLAEEHVVTVTDGISKAMLFFSQSSTIKIPNRIESEARPQLTTNII